MSTKDLIRWPAASTSTVLLVAALLIGIPVPASATVPNREIVAARRASNSADKG